MLGPFNTYRKLWQALMKYKTVNWITNRKAASYKPQASSAKLRKIQAASHKPKAASLKLQAASDKLLDL